MKKAATLGALLTLLSGCGGPGMDMHKTHEQKRAIARAEFEREEAELERRREEVEAILDERWRHNPEVRDYLEYDAAHERWIKHLVNLIPEQTKLQRFAIYAEGEGEKHADCI